MKMISKRYGNQVRNSKFEIRNLFHILLLLTVSAMMACFVPACRQNQTPPNAPPPPLVETFNSGLIQLTMTADPAQVHLDRDILLTFRVSSPSNMEVRLPPLENRLKGFVLNGSFSREAVEKDGKANREYCFRLTPTLAEEYRIAPMAVTWSDLGKYPLNGGLPPEAVSAKEGLPPEVPSEKRLETKGGWFMTRPINFKSTGVIIGLPPASIHEFLGPVWIFPPIKMVAGWIALILGTIAVLVLIWWLSKRVHKAIKLRRMSPRERALYELNELLALGLVEKQKIKEFYLEITMIVRRYIERAHHIRAPEQTTEEFLVTATQNPEFSRAVVLKLRAFLQTADLVKFAAYRPEQGVIDQTIATARDYIETDEQSAFVNQQTSMDNTKKALN
jgi:hypothetical protein